jgi:hypothetical protein
MPTEIPAHQLCTDGCGRVRALAKGVTGFASLCEQCFYDRINDAKRKAAKKPIKATPTNFHIQTEREMYDAMREAMTMSEEELNAPLENLEEL